ncbi:hypothetical protein AB3M83_08975 [Microbacterium sp. 179-B 1A2 NHS]|uniref:hypothetical protein n=1 Tax=Microbacterium sp. 179-B 1A2 NHS TaxID=3142383 RepID=UPI0039A0B1DA
MSDDAAVDDSPSPSPADVAAVVSARRFTQSEVDQIVQERLRRSRPSDYEEVARTAEAVDEMERLIGEKEQALAQARFEARRDALALHHAVPIDLRDEFMTSTDETTLAMQAERLARLAAQQRATGNVAPREGSVRVSGASNDREERHFVNDLFGNDNF